MRGSPAVVAVNGSAGGGGRGWMGERAAACVGGGRRAVAACVGDGLSGRTTATCVGGGWSEQRRLAWDGGDLRGRRVQQTAAAASAGSGGMAGGVDRWRLHPTGGVSTIKILFMIN